MSDEPDLSLVSTEALIDELFKRYDAVAVIREATVTNRTNECLYDFKGGVSTALGMCIRLQDALRDMARGSRQMQERTEPDEPTGD
jgi:hypothetical protein